MLKYENQFLRRKELARAARNRSAEKLIFFLLLSPVFILSAQARLGNNTIRTITVSQEKADITESRQRADSPEQEKEQHYIPKFYLKGFTDDQRKLWVCERFKRIRESKPKHEAHRPDYYTHAEKGDRDETAENVLKEVESRAAPIVRKLASPQYVLTPANAGHLIMFVAFMFVRVPAWREHLDKVAAQVFRDSQLKKAQDKEAFHASCVDFEKATGRSLGNFEEMRQYILKGEYDLIQQSRAFNLGAMFTSGFKVIDELKTMGYQALYAPEGKFFLSSDSPVYTIRPDGMGQATVGMGFGWPKVEVYFPLNKRTCLRMKKGIEPKGWTAEPGRVDEINDLIMATATQYLYSSQGQKRIARLFDERGCKVRAGKNAFMLTPEPPKSNMRSADEKNRRVPDAPISLNTVQGKPRA